MTSLPVVPDDLVAELRPWFARAGLADPFTELGKLATVDTDRIREVGKNQWGPTGKDRHQGDSELAHVLNTKPDELVENLLTTVQDRWKDDGYEALDAYVKDLRKIEESIPSQMEAVGSALEDFADSFEVKWTEVIGVVIALCAAAVAIIGLIVAVVGLVVAIASIAAGSGATATVVGSVVGVPLAIAGLVVALVSLLVAIVSAVLAFLALLPLYFTSIQHRVAAVETAVRELKTPARKGVLRPDLEHAKWKRKSDDPYS